MSTTTTSTKRVLPAILLGGGRFGYQDPSCGDLTEPSQIQPLIDILHAHGHDTIDTSRLYPSTGAPGGSETLIGLTNHSSRGGLVDTKVLSHAGQHEPSKIASCIRDSLAALKIDKINILYAHYPDRTVPLTSSIPALASAVTQGLATRWAISNYSIAEVEQIVQICKSQNLPLPYAYQGNYSALVRSAEPELLPLLRQHNIAFIAYSPTAGGAFSPHSTRMKDQGQIGAILRSWYGSPQATAAIQHVRTLATQHGISSGHEIALRWTAYHSALDGGRGDGLIVGASSAQQLEETLTALDRGPLPKEVADAMEALWIEGGVREGAPGYSPFLGDLDFRPGNEVKN